MIRRFVYWEVSSGRPTLSGFDYYMWRGGEALRASERSAPALPAVGAPAVPPGEPEQPQGVQEPERPQDEREDEEPRVEEGEHLRG